jgi:hypothetical protein
MGGGQDAWLQGGPPYRRATQEFWKLFIEGGVICRQAMFKAIHLFWRKHIFHQAKPVRFGDAPDGV